MHVGMVTNMVNLTLILSHGSFYSDWSDQQAAELLVKDCALSDVWCLRVYREEDEESDGVASNQSAEDGSVNENMNNCSVTGSTGMCVCDVSESNGFCCWSVNW